MAMKPTEAYMTSTTVQTTIYNQSTPLILGHYFRKGETKDDLTKAMSNSSSIEYSVIDLS